MVRDEGTRLLTTGDAEAVGDGPHAHDVRLLGSVRVLTTLGSPIDLGGPKPRMVLVRVALRAGEVVSTDSLIDTLWGDDPPPTARRSLQAHVAKLRAALGGDDGPLRSSGPGYLFDVSREAVDVLRIEDRLASVRELLSSDLHHAADVIAACREDWTGTPLADLEGYDSLVADRERLARLGDELDDMEIELHVALGDPSSAVVRLERAVVDQPTHEPHWIRLITAYYASGRQQDALDAYQRASRSLLDQLGIDPSPQLQRLELQILHQEVDTADSPETCPYKGLASYQIADGHVFYGRFDTTDELVNLVMSTPVCVVVGPSGVGKSSVLRAGLAHRVVSGQVPGLRSVAVITPGSQPLRSLYEAGQVIDLLVVDQFEELFTLTDDLTRRSEFVDELLSLAESGRTRVVLSLRADFYGHCLTVPALVPLLGGHQMIVGSMSELGLREAVMGPAAQVGLEIEPALLDALVDEVSDHPGALPLLSHALRETWRRRSGSSLTLAGYRDAGSIAGAIAATAERLHAGIDVDNQRQLERLFRRLVEPGSGTQHTRRAVDRAELEGAGFDRDLIDRLVTARLLTATTQQVEIAHEALISAWPRLNEWIDGERDNIVVQQGLTRSTRSWLEADKDDAELYRGNKLSSAVTWHESAAPALSSEEEEFLEASEDSAKAEAARQRRTNQRLRILTGVSVVAMVAALGASFFAVGRSRDADRRREQIEVNQLVTAFAADDSLTQTDRLRVAVALQTRASTLETSAFLFKTLIEAPDIVTGPNLDILAITGSAPVHSTGMAILVADTNVRPAIIHGTTLELDRSVIGFTPKFVVERPDGILAVDDETYEVIDVSDGRRALGPAPLFDGKPASVALSSDGLVLALGFDGDDAGGGSGAGIDVFDVISGERTARILSDGSSRVDELEFTRKGSRLLGIFDDVALELWDLTRTPAEPIFRTNVDPGLTAAVTTSAFNIRGDAIALGRRDGTIEIWRETDGLWRRVAPPKQHDDEVSWIEFDPEDGLVVSSSFDGSAAVWDAFDGALLTGPVRFGATGSLISFFDIENGDVLTIGSSGQTWRWSAQSGGSLVTTLDVVAGFPPSADTPGWVGVRSGAAVAVTDTTVVDLGLDGGVLDVVDGRAGNYAVVYPDRLDWRRPNGERVMSIPVAGLRAGPNPVSVTAGSIAFWDGESKLIRIINADGVMVEEIAFSAVRLGELARMDLSPSGRDLIYSTSGGELIWYSLDNFDAEVLLEGGVGYEGHFIDDHVAVAVGADGVQLIDFAQPLPLVTTLNFGHGAVAVAFDESRGVAATSDASGRVTLWDIDSGRRVGPTFNPLGSVLNSWIGFDGGGRLIVGSPTATAVMPADQQLWPGLACTVVRAADPDGDIPPDPRLAEFEACR